MSDSGLPRGTRDPDGGAASIPRGSSNVPSDVELFSAADRAGDAALMAGLAVGDGSAAVAFVRRFQGPVYGLAMSITRDPELAQDVAQEVFLRAWKAAASYDARRASALTWLLTITRNASIDVVRANRSAPTDPALLEEIISATMHLPGPEDEVVRHTQRDAAVEALRTLPPEQARAVVLAVIGGRTAVEVSAHEGIPLGTAKTRIRTGLRRVREALGVVDDA
jgi:RNA polymerase sigma factor (sigma-70 family)